MGKKAQLKWHSLSSAEVLIAMNDASDVRGPFYPAGNTPKFAFQTMGDDLAPVKDWTNAGAPLLGNLLKGRIPEFTATLQEVRVNLLRLGFMADITEYTQPATAVVAEALGKVYLGGIYQLAKPLVALSPALTLTDTDATPHPYTLGTHYTLDRTLGQIEILAIPAGGAEGDSITASYTPTAIVAGSGYPELYLGTATQRLGAMLVTGIPSRGPAQQIYIPRCQFELDGGFDMVSEDPLSYTLKINVLSNTELPSGALARYRQIAPPTT